MDLIKPQINQHDLFINALMNSQFDLHTMVQKVRAYVETLNRRQRLAFVHAINEYLVDAEFFNKQEKVHKLREISRTIPHFN